MEFKNLNKINAARNYSNRSFKIYLIVRCCDIYFTTFHEYAQLSLKNTHTGPRMYSQNTHTKYYSLYLSQDLENSRKWVPMIGIIIYIYIYIYMLENVALAWGRNKNAVRSLVT